MRRIIWIVFFCLIATLVDCQTRQKRQVSFGFGIPNANHNHNHHAHTAGQALGQTIGNTINTLLGGFLGGGNQHQPSRIQEQPGINNFPNANPFDGGGRGCNINNGGCEQGCAIRRLRVQCFCNPGYVLNRDLKSCSDIDECALGPQQVCQEHCENTVGSYQCSCFNGVLLEDGRSCGQSQATCADANGGCQQECKDRPRRGGVQCLCSNGYVLAEDQRSCIDIDECSSGSHNCQVGQICKNTIGSYECLVDAAATSCDINKGGCEQRCIENRRGIRCACRKGFELLSDGKSCQDIDECQTGAHNCQEICINKPGKFECTTQTQQDGCSVNNGGCEQKCRQNKKGVLRCACRKGFDLKEDGKSCVPTSGGGTGNDPCLIDNGGCDQTCVNEGGSAKCECRDGFVLASGRCQHVIIQPSPTPIESSPKPPQQKGCGVNTKKSLFRRIVGGKPADPKDWPWMAAILRSSGSQFCGGALITDQHVLTAAHCVVQFTKDDIKVRLGEYNFDSPDENNPTDFRVDDIKSHENYNQQTQENDIAILKLGRPSSFSEFIWPVCLPPPNNEFEDQLGYVTGWGTIHFGGPVSNVLQEIVIPVWKQTDCASAYPENNVSDNMMCAGLKAGGKDSCQGDSGGPFLVQIFPETRWYVAGVVSWGIECASANRPGVYTRVNKYLDWIKANSVF